MAQKFIEICISKEAQAYLLGLDFRTPSTKSAIEYVLDDNQLAGLKEKVGENSYNNVVYNREIIKVSLETALNSVNNNVNIAGGLACFSKNISKCWTHYETYMRQIYHDISYNNKPKSLIKEQLSVLEQNIKGELK